MANLLRSLGKDGPRPGANHNNPNDDVKRLSCERVTQFVSNPTGEARINSKPTEFRHGDCDEHDQKLHEDWLGGIKKDRQQDSKIDEWHRAADLQTQTFCKKAGLARRVFATHTHIRERSEHDGQGEIKDHNKADHFESKRDGGEGFEKRACSARRQKEPKNIGRRNPAGRKHSRTEPVSEGTGHDEHDRRAGCQPACAKENDQLQPRLKVQSDSPTFSGSALAASALSVTAMTDPSDHIEDKPEAPMENAPLQGVLAHVLSEMDGEDSNLRNIVASMGHRAFGPVMVLCGLFMMTPLGAIPGVPPAFGLINIAFAVQLLARRPHPWVPDILARVKVPYKRVSQVHDKVAPWLAKIDNIIRPRLAWATEGVMLILAALVAILLSAAMVPLGLIPFGVVPAAFILGLMGLALIARDGILMLIALSVSLGIFGWVGSLLF